MLPLFPDYLVWLNPSWQDDVPFQEESVQKYISGGICYKNIFQAESVQNIFQVESEQKYISGGISTKISFRRNLYKNIFQAESVQKYISGRICYKK